MDTITKEMVDRIVEDIECEAYRVADEEPVEAEIETCTDGLNFSVRFNVVSVLDRYRPATYDHPEEVDGHLDICDVEVTTFDDEGEYADCPFDGGDVYQYLIQSLSEYNVDIVYFAEHKKAV